MLCLCIRIPHVTCVSALFRYLGKSDKIDCNGLFELFWNWHGPYGFHKINICLINLTCKIFINHWFSFKVHLKNILEDEKFIMQLFPAEERTTQAALVFTSYLETVTAQKATFAMACFKVISVDIIKASITYCKLQPNYTNHVILQSIRRKLFKLFIPTK